MKTQKLIPLLDYVLEQTGKIKPGCDYTNDQILIRIAKYARFLAEPLKLSMFVVCDEQGNILKEPTVDNYMQPKEIDRQYKAYNKAKSNVLFEGFEITEDKDIENEFVIMNNDSFEVAYNVINGFRFHFKKIEDLIKHDLTLTENAVKLING